MSDDRLLEDLRGAYDAAPVPDVDARHVVARARRRRRRSALGAVTAACITAVAVAAGVSWVLPRWDEDAKVAEGLPLYAPDGDLDPLGLVGVWRVTQAPALGDDAWLRVEAGSFEVWRDCGSVGGVWDANGAALIALADGHDLGCDEGTVERTFVWAAGLHAYAEAAGGWELRGADGAVLAHLTRPGDAVPPATARDSLTTAPTIDAGAAARLAGPAPLPDGLVPAAPWDLVGRWVPATGPRPTDPQATFSQDGVWQAFDGCHGHGGRWAVDAGGALLVVPPPGPVLDYACELAEVDNPPVLSWLAAAERVALDGEELVLIGLDGTEGARMVRDTRERRPIRLAEAVLTAPDVLHVSVPTCGSDPQVITLEEDEKEVRIRVDVPIEPPGTNECLDGVEVQLAAPLGDRRIVDLVSGDEVQGPRFE